MDFAAFIVLNAVMLLQPEQLFPEVAGLRLYLIAIAVAATVALPKLLAVLGPGELRRRPVAACVLGLLAASFVTFAARGRVADGFDFCGEFAKVVLYYFLLVAVVDTPDRLRAFAGWLVALVLALTGVSLAHYHGLAQFPGLDPAKQWQYDPKTGEVVEIARIVGTGVFADPNDLCLILALGMGLCVYRAVTADGPAGRVGWVAPTAPMGYAFTLTYSKGGLLGLLTGVVAWLVARYGWKKTMPLAAVVLPAVLAGVGGRQADIGGGGTAHERLMYWAHGLGDLFRQPLYIPTGLGVGYIAEEFGQVAHNSFVTGYVEGGVLGGGLFLGAFYLAGRRAAEVGRAGPVAEWAAAARPYVVAMVAAYAAGCYSLTRNFVLPTYLVLGLGTAYVSLAVPDPPERDLVSRELAAKLAALGVAGLVAMKYMTQVLGQLGV